MTSLWRTDVGGDDIVLGGYPAKWCPRRTHNDYAPDSPEPLDTSPELRKLFDLGNEFETAATEALQEALGDRMVIIDAHDGQWDDAIEATFEALEAGVEVIVNGPATPIGVAPARRPTVQDLIEAAR